MDLWREASGLANEATALEMSGHLEGALVLYDRALERLQALADAVHPGSRMGASVVAAINSIARRAAAVEDRLRPSSVSFPLTQILQQDEKPFVVAAAESPETTTAAAAAASPAIAESTLFAGGDKGFTNRLGENNCFLNVVLQALWHLGAFSTRFAALEQHRHADPCVFCALKAIFSDYQFGDDAHVLPDSVRRALSTIFAPESRFQLGAFADAAETYEALLTKLHEEVCDTKASADSCTCSPPCVAHKVFGLNVLEQAVCTECGATSEPQTFQQWLFYAPAASLAKYHDADPDLPLDALLAKVQSEDVRSCPAEQPCGGVGGEEEEEGKKRRTGRLNRYLSGSPEVFAVGLAWVPEDAEDTDRIEKSVVHLISERIRAGAVFDAADDRDAVYDLRGVICFYGRHYVSFFHSGRHRNGRVWKSFDDTLVRTVGDGTFADVRQKALAGHLHPTVLFYAKA